MALHLPSYRICRYCYWYVEDEEVNGVREGEDIKQTSHSAEEGHEARPVSEGKVIFRTIMNLYSYTTIVVY